MLMRMALLAILLVTSGCAWNAAGHTGCQPVAPPYPLPDGLQESSGVASSRIHPGILWTHNDGEEPTLYALSLDGQLRARIPVQAPPARDIEDIAVGECFWESCLYLADTGDNQEVRPQSQLLRIPEPHSLDDPGSLAAEAFPFVLPDGPRDIEAVFVLPGEDVYFVSKGRQDPIAVYRYPSPLRREVVTLETVQTLSDGSRPIPSQVTGADASPDGRLVIVRSYEALVFYRVQGGRMIPIDGGRVSLGTLHEPQGEGVAFGPGPRVLLTTEAGNFGGVAALRVLECREVMAR